MDTLQEWKVNDDMSLVTMTPNEAMQRRALLVAYISNAMKEGRDYGIIPGTEKKSLWKAGAEKLCSFFGYSFQILPVETVLDWTGKNTDGEPFFFFRHKCILRHGAVLVGDTEASCNSFEKKYRWREGKRRCPKCHRETIFRSKPRKDDLPGKSMGFYCWEKKGGCGTQFTANDTSITNQQVGMVKNDEIFDQVNTIQKMSEKRSLVGTTIIACNASEFFALLDTDDDDVIDGDYRPVITKSEETPEEIQAKMQAASASLRGDQGDLGPSWSNESESTQTQPEPPAPEPKPEPQNGKSPKAATLKYQPFVTWCNEWVKDARAAKYAKEEGGQANMYHILSRVAKLGFSEVTTENIEAVKARLQEHIEKEAK